MQIKKAEEVLGFPVFDRSKTPLELSPFGERLIQVLRNVQTEYDRIDEVVKKESGTFKEVIRIGVIPTIASYLIVDMYEAWKKELNNHQVIINELTTEDLLKELDKGTVDLAIMAGPVHNPQWRVTPLFLEEIKAYFPSIVTDEVSAEDIESSHPWLLTPGNCLRTQMIHFCGLKNDQMNDNWDYQGGNIDLLIEMVKMNGGYTLVPVNHSSKLNPELKTIRSVNGEVPAREVIAISNNRTLKWDSLEKLIRTMQLKYNKESNDKLEVLSWK